MNAVLGLLRFCSQQVFKHESSQELLETNSIKKVSKLHIIKYVLTESFWILLDIALIAISIVLALIVRKGDQLYFTILPVLFIGMRRGLFGNMIVVPVTSFIFMLISTIQQRTYENIIDVQLFMIALMLMVYASILCSYNCMYTGYHDWCICRSQNHIST